MNKLLNFVSFSRYRSVMNFDNVYGELNIISMLLKLYFTLVIMEVSSSNIANNSSIILLLGLCLLIFSITIDNCGSVLGILRSCLFIVLFVLIMLSVDFINMSA